jgi:hypothetical protein
MKVVARVPGFFQTPRRTSPPTVNSSNYADRSRCGGFVPIVSESSTNRNEDLRPWID